MKILEKKFTQLGYTLEQIKREGNIAIYKRSKPGHSLVEYEVIIIKNYKEYQIAGHTIKAGETYPGAKSFGTLGWSCSSLERAEKRFKELLKRESQPYKRGRRKLNGSN